MLLTKVNFCDSIFGYRRIPVCACSSVDRVPGYEPVGRRFESSRARQQKENFCLSKVLFLFIQAARLGISSAPAGTGYNHVPACILLRLDDTKTVNLSVNRLCTCKQTLSSIDKTVILWYNSNYCNYMSIYAASG